MTKTQFIPMDVIMEFNLKFSNHQKLQRPNICDNLEHIEPMQEEETPPATPKENLGVLDQIKEMLAESRLVPVHMKDNEIPARARAHTHHLPTRHSFSIHTNHNEDIPIVPRKMFLGSPPPVKLDLVQELKLAGPSVKDRRKLFEQTQLFKPQVVTTTSPKMQAINEEQSATVNLPSVEELKIEENNTEQSKVEKIKTSEVILEIHEDNNQQSENNVVSIEIEVPTHQEQISVQRTNQIDEVKEENKAEIKEMEIQKAPIIDINDLM